MDMQQAYLFASSIGNIAFDTTIDETHTSTLAVSDYPVELGAPLTDHTYIKPDVLTLNIAHGLIPLDAREQQGNPLRMLHFVDALKNAQQAGELLEIVTGIKRYTDMLITQTVIRRDRQRTTVMGVTVTLQQMFVVSPLAVDDFDARYANAAGIDRRAASSQRRGQVELPEPTAGEANQLKSILASSVDALFN